MEKFKYLRKGSKKTDSNGGTCYMGRSREAINEVTNEYEIIRGRHGRLLAEAAAININYDLSKKPELEGQALLLDADIQKLKREIEETVESPSLSAKDKARLQVFKKRLDAFAQFWRLKILSTWDQRLEDELTSIKNKHVALFADAAAENFKSPNLLSKVFALQKDIDRLIIKYDTEILSRNRKKWPFTKLQALSRDARNFRALFMRKWGGKVGGDLPAVKR
ncbi:MAG: hypothetical protein AB1668_03450 [Nanoarchaeota archaeon]